MGKPKDRTLGVDEELARRERAFWTGRLDELGDDYEALFTDDEVIIPEPELKSLRVERVFPDVPRGDDADNWLRDNDPEYWGDDEDQ